MSDLKSQLQDYVEANIERVDIDDLANTVLAQPEARPQPQSVRRAWLTPQRGPAAVAGLAAVIAVLLIGSAWLLTLGGDDSPVVTQSGTPGSTVPQATTTPMVPAEGSWHPILSTTRAKAAPPAATCPPGTDPSTPGPTDQERPGPGGWSNQAAVFDQYTGRIVYVDEMAATWTFDVCTNMWQRMDPDGIPHGVVPELGATQIVGELVYDADSERVISVGFGRVDIYDAATNTWERRKPPDIDLGGHGAVYDPASGLVLVVTGEGSLVAYDVETDAWTVVGIITEQREVTSEGQTKMLVPPFMIGHVAEADRMAFLGFDGAPFQAEGGLLNPRTGGTAPLEQPAGGVVGGFGSFAYATGGETAYTLANTVIGPGTTSIGVGSMRICRLDPTSFEWTCSSHQPPGAPGLRQSPSAMVIDSVNNRLVIINDSCCVWPGSTTTNDVWAIDLDTGETIELLASNQQTYHDQD